MPEGRGGPSSPVTLILPKYLLPVRPARCVLEGHAVVVEHGRIAAVLPRAEALANWPEGELVELPEHALLPGLINSHTHAPMTLLRGYADDMPLQTWLKEHIWPAERAFVGAEFVADGTRLAIAEMFRGGTTCFNDMYFFPDATVDVCLAAGMRVSVGITVIEMESAWARDVDEYIDKGLELRERHRDEALVRFTLSPHAPYTVSDHTLKRIGELSEASEIPVHMHLLETEWEVRQSVQQHGMPPLQRLQRLGLLNPRLQAVHMAQLSLDDVDRVAASGMHVVHCPQSNLKLASGFCPLAALSRAGVNLALGTDGAASNNDLDLLGEAQTAALLAKGVAGDAAVVDAFDAVEMMTLGGARALGMAAEVGSIEVGKQADFSALDLSAPETQPLYHVPSQVVYAASSRQFTDVWVAGRRVLERGALTSLDLHEVLARANAWRDRLARLAPATQNLEETAS